MQKEDEILSKLNYLQNKFMKVLDSLSVKDLETTIQEESDGWTTIEILRHIAVTEEEIIGLIEEVISGGSGVSKDFDIDQTNAEYRQKYEDMGVDQIQERMRKSRERTLAFMSNISGRSSDDVWEKKGIYFNQEEMTVARMFQILMWHQNHHLKQIIEKLDLNL